MSNDATPFSGSAQPLSEPPRLEALALSWVHPQGMVGLSFKNFLYRIITLGIYNFWGKTEVRKRIWSAIRINGEPLQYTGTGKEMLLGFLFVLVVLTVPALLIVLGGLAIAGEQGANIAQSIISIVFFYLVGVGLHRAIRYRTSRTLWRGIRGGLEGDSWKYGWTYFWTGAVMTVTLGWAAPWRAVKLQGLVSNGLRFGNRPFRFDATSGPLYVPFAVLWFSALGIVALIGFGLFRLWLRLAPMIGTPRQGQPVDPMTLFAIIGVIYGALILGLLLYAVISAWYRARMMNHFAAHTSFEGVRFEGTATGRGLVWIGLTNMLMVIFTLGLLSPVAQARSARYFVEHLQMIGGAPLDQILQGAFDEGRGEGLAQAFDIDAF